MSTSNLLKAKAIVDAEAAYIPSQDARGRLMDAIASALEREREDWKGLLIAVHPPHPQPEICDACIQIGRAIRSRRPTPQAPEASAAIEKEEG